MILRAAADADTQRISCIPAVSIAPSKGTDMRLCESRGGKLGKRTKSTNSVADLCEIDRTTKRGISVLQKFHLQQTVGYTIPTSLRKELPSQEAICLQGCKSERLSESQ